MKSKTPQMPKDFNEQKGPLYPPDSLFLRSERGTATDGDRTVYELSMFLFGGSVLIRSRKTGQWWAPIWKWLIEQAKLAGIDDEGEPMKPELKKRAR